MKHAPLLSWKYQILKGLQTLILSSGVMLAHAENRKSGFDFMQPATQTMQSDDAQNPAMLWVADGETQWHLQQGGANKSCATCHADASKSMRGVAARYPAFSNATAKPINLQQRINQCRVSNQKATALPLEHQTLLNLETYIALQSRGLPLTQSKNPKLAQARKQGEALFNQRMGQLDLSCKDCHQNNAGKRLGGNLIPQAHPTAYPLYRLEWQAVGSLQRRLRNCMTGVRAEAFNYGSDEMLALEVYLAQRAQGMMMDAPGVRP
jgi:L-cysteine S-thiosulfotransferase